MTIVITGSEGLLGRHLRYRLWREPCYRERVIPIDRHAFNDDAQLVDALASAHVIIHLAGINRDMEERLEVGNRLLAERLVAMLERDGKAPMVLYASSIQRDSDTPYGRGKLAAHEVFADWSQRSGAPYCEMVLPHIFGEGGRPHYNSVVATFCHQLASGERLDLNPEGTLELLHAQDVANSCLDIIARSATGSCRLHGRPYRVPSLAGKLLDMHSSYKSGVIPDLRDFLDLQLFNTLRSYLYPGFYPQLLPLHSDERGSLFEAVKSLHGGQTFLSTTRPGITRGNHLHFHKVERFLVISGRAVIRLRRLLDDEVMSFQVSGEVPAIIDMPTFHTHSITNVGNSELITLFWSHELFDPEAPDTYAEPVMPAEVIE